MGLWMMSANLLLQGCTAAMLGIWLTRYRNARGIATGVTVGLTLFGWLPIALHQCSTLVLACAMVLGVILSIFLQESTSRHRELLWSSWLMLCSLLQIKGILGNISIPYLLPVQLALGGSLRIWLCLTTMLVGLMTGYLAPIPTVWLGSLLALGCGMLLQGIHYNEKKSFAGGIAIGVILSFI